MVETPVELDSAVDTCEREGTFSFSDGALSFPSGAFESAKVTWFFPFKLFCCRSFSTSNKKPSAASCSLASLRDRRAAAALELDEDGVELPLPSLTEVLVVDEEASCELDDVGAAGVHPDGGLKLDEDGRNPPTTSLTEVLEDDKEAAQLLEDVDATKVPRNGAREPEEVERELRLRGTSGCELWELRLVEGERGLRNACDRVREARFTDTDIGDVGFRGRGRLVDGADAPPAVDFDDRGRPVPSFAVASFA